MSDPSSKASSNFLKGGRYELIRRLGAGGMGEVFLAKDHQKQKNLVIKVPHKALFRDAGFAARFRREVKSLIQLRHPNIVPTTDVGNHKGLPYVVMRYLSGGSLEDRLNDGRLLESSLGDWLPSIATALDYVHVQGFIHRDIKPANIFFDSQGNAFLGDFGIAKTTSELETSETHAAKLTGTGMAMGTPDYMAPELIMSDNVDHRADQYALAVTVYQVMSGRLPFEGATPAAVMVKQSTMPAPSLRVSCQQASDAAVAGVDRALSKMPGDRYDSCSEFAEAVLQSVGATGQGEKRQSSTQRSEKTKGVECPECGHSLRLKSRHAEKLLRCSGCHQTFRVAKDYSSLSIVDPESSETTSHSTADLGTTSLPKRKTRKRKSGDQQSDTTKTAKRTAAAGGRGGVPSAPRMPGRSAVAAMLGFGLLASSVIGYALWRSDGQSEQPKTAARSERLEVATQSAQGAASEGAAPVAKMLTLMFVDSVSKRPVPAVMAEFGGGAEEDDVTAVKSDARGIVVLPFSESLTTLNLAAAGYVSRSLDVDPAQSPRTVVLDRDVIVTGRVIAEFSPPSDKNPLLQDADLTLTDPASTEVWQQQSDSRGEFRYSGLKPGTYTLTAAVQGFHETSQSFTLNHGFNDLSIPLRQMNADFEQAMDHLLTDGWGPEEDAIVVAEEQIKRITAADPKSLVGQIAIDLVKASQGSWDERETSAYATSLPAPLQQMNSGMRLFTAAQSADGIRILAALDTLEQIPVTRADVAHLMGTVSTVLRGPLTKGEIEPNKMNARLMKNISASVHEDFRAGGSKADEQIAETKREIAAARISLKNTQDANKSKTKAELQTTLDDGVKRMAELTTTLAEYDQKGVKEFQRLDTELASLTVRKNRAGAEIATIGQSIGNLQNSMNGLRTQIRNLQTNAANNPDQAASINRQIANLNTQGATLQTQNRVQQAQFLARSQEHEQCVAELRKINDRKTSINKDYFKEGSAIDAEFKELEKSTDSLRNAISRQDTDALPTDNEAIRKLQEKLKTPADYLRSPLPAWRDELRQLATKAIAPEEM